MTKAKYEVLMFVLQQLSNTVDKAIKQLEEIEAKEKSVCQNLK